jgi:sulfatase maturation enzyme AslB (radical SAM superfamily)
MTVDEYNSLSSQLGFLEKISLTGGEPFLRDDLASIAEIFYRNNHCKTIGINSNGICSDKIFVTIEKILKTCPKANLGLCLGIDGLGNVHDMARGTENAFRQLTETCNGLARIKKKFSRLHLSLNFTLTNKNIQEFIPLYEFSKKNFSDYWPFGFSVLLPKDFDNKAIAGRPQDASLSQPDLIDIKNLSDMIQGDFRKSGIIDLKYLMKKTYFKHTIAKCIKKKQLTKCLVGDLCSVVDELGNVYFCEFLKNIGNVKK